MKLKIDCCSLILLQHLGIIPLVDDVIGKLVITEEVYREAIEEGIKKQKTIADKLAIHCELGNLLRVRNRGRLPLKLGSGEAETLAESKYEHDRGEKVICITEDKKAKREAIALHLALLGVDSLLVELCLRGHLTEDEFDEKIITLDKYHKLSLIRITELRRFIHFINLKHKKE
jgi:predicted nucleic acid-binding protein